MGKKSSKRNKIPKDLDIEEIVEMEERLLKKIEEDEKLEQNKENLEDAEENEEDIEEFEDAEENEENIEEFEDVEEQNEEDIEDDVEEQENETEKLDKMQEFRESLQKQNTQKSTHTREPATEKRFENYIKRKETEDAEEVRREALLKAMNKLEEQEER